MYGVLAGQIIREMPRRAPPQPSAYGLRSRWRPPRHRSVAGAWACAWLSFRAVKSKFPGVWCLIIFGTEGQPLAERGIVVSYETIRRWCRKFGQTFATSLRRRRPLLGDKLHLDEMFVDIQGVQHYLWRDVDLDGVLLDALVQDRLMPKPPSASSSGC
jgi:hypothetical protein